jgi:hypothetical protein
MALILITLLALKILSQVTSFNALQEGKLTFSVSAIPFEIGALAVCRRDTSFLVCVYI